MQLFVQAGDWVSGFLKARGKGLAWSGARRGRCPSLRLPTPLGLLRWSCCPGSVHGAMRCVPLTWGSVQKLELQLGHFGCRRGDIAGATELVTSPVGAEGQLPPPEGGGPEEPGPPHRVGGPCGIGANCPPTPRALSLPAPRLQAPGGPS